MTFLAVPEIIFPTVTTAESRGSVFLLTIVWRFMTVAAAITDASVQRCGFPAWPDFPLMSIENQSVAAILGPASREIFPASIPEKIWSPNISFTSSKSPDSRTSFAPWAVSSAGWKTRNTFFDNSFSCFFRIPAVPKRMAACPSCPQACIYPWCSDPKEHPVSSSTFNASISALSAAASLPFPISATMPVGYSGL